MCEPRPKKPQPTWRSQPSPVSSTLTAAFCQVFCWYLAWHLNKRNWHAAQRITHGTSSGHISPYFLEKGTSRQSDSWCRRGFTMSSWKQGKGFKLMTSSGQQPQVVQPAALQQEHPGTATVEHQWAERKTRCLLSFTSASATASRKVRWANSSASEGTV